MPKSPHYRRRLLRAVEAFLQETPASIAQGRRIIQRCYTALQAEPQEFTLDGLIWRSLAWPLTDSVYYTSREYLQEVRNILLGLPSQEREKTFIKEDLRPYLTAAEAEWYAQLCSMVDFIASLPFAQVAAAATEARQRKVPGSIIVETIPEAASIKAAYENYEQRKAAIEALAARVPLPEHVGEETIYRLVLREVTALVTAVDIRLSAVYYGHPSPLPPYSGGGSDSDMSYYGSSPDMSEPLAWARRALRALAGEGYLFFSWQLVAAPSFGADLLVVSLH
jgi:hypothetical protein